MIGLYCIVHQGTFCKAEGSRELTFWENDAGEGGEGRACCWQSDFWLRNFLHYV